MVKNILTSMEAGIFKVLVDSAKPSNVFMGVEVKDITEWPFADVLNMCTNSTPINMVKLATGLSEEEIEKGDENDFIKLLAHLKEEIKKIEKLEAMLKSEPNPDLVAAGIEKLNKYGVISVYNAINPDPRTWDEISKLPYHLVWAKLAITKESAEVQKEYDRIIMDKQKKQR